MRNYEREVIQAQLGGEKAVLRSLEKEYRAALEQINEKIKLLQSDELTQSRVYQIQYQQALKGQIEAILEKLHGDEYSTIQQYLSDSYSEGFLGTMYSVHKQGIPVIIPIDKNAAVKAVLTDSKLSAPLYEALGLDIKAMKRSIRAEISRGIASGMSYADIARNLQNAARAPFDRAKTIVRTEGHRIQQESAEDARQEARKKGADVVKQWDATLDGATRATHRNLDGQIKETDEPFAYGGKKAMYPGAFGDPAEDCNCRCVALTRARWALDEEELATLKERAAFFELDKQDSFEDFKKKYLKAAETLKNKGKSGIIKVEKTSVKDAVSSGVVTTKINAEKQGRHIKTSPAYIEGRSYINGTLEDAQRLVDDLSGTGVPLMDADGNWLHKERVQTDHVFGIHVDPETGQETETTKGMIIYSKTGTHIIPRKEDDK